MSKSLLSDCCHAQVRMLNTKKIDTNIVLSEQTVNWSYIM